MLVGLVRYNLRPLINKERLALSTMSLMCKVTRLARTDVDICDYQSCCIMYRRSSDLRALSEKLMDKALHMKIPETDRLILQLSTVVTVCEALEAVFMETVDRSGRLLSKSRRLQYQFSEENEDKSNGCETCPICCNHDIKGKWVLCSDCEQEAICPECASRMTSCPYCRSTKSFQNNIQGQL